MPVPPSSRATMKDVAALAGVSAKTVSNVVTAAVLVRPETRARVEAAMAELDFVPNLSARRLRNGRSGVIALALPSLATAYSAEMVHRIVAAAHARGLAVQIEETASDPGREGALLARARSHLVDGLILNPIRLEDSALQHADHLPPVVVIGEVEQQRADHVHIDSRAAAADVARHLIARGARRIAVVGADRDASIATATSALRLAGVHDALREAGMAADAALEVNLPAWSMASGAESVAVLRGRGVEFDAVLALTDSIAVGVLHALHAEGVRVPDDLLVTGFDDVEVAEFTTPALTTVTIDRAALADAALSLLESRIDDRDAPPRSITLPHRLRVRASSGG